MSEDPYALLERIVSMSRENRADMPIDRPEGEISPPWLVALVRDVLRGWKWDDWTTRPSSRHVLPVYDGDRPADLTDKQIAEARSWEPEYRNRCRTRDQRALVFREAIHDRGRGDGYAASVRETHTVVHAALAGEDPTWCTHCYPDARAGTHSVPAEVFR